MVFDATPVGKRPPVRRWQKSRFFELAQRPMITAPA
jgi:hypothetical protein